MAKRKLFNRRREKAEEKKGINASGYGDAGASQQKRALKGFIANSLSANRDINDNNSTLRQRARMLYMASPVATSAINTNRTKVVGGGLHMRAAIDRSILGLSEEAADEWMKTVEAEWEMWSERKNNCDALGLNNFYELQQIALKSWLTSGDIFALFKREDHRTSMNPYTLRIQLIEADRVSTPSTFRGSISFGSLTDGTADNGNKIYDGVEVDDNGNVVAYHICSDYPQNIIKSNVKWTRVQAIGDNTGLPNIVQVMDCERPDQYRGVSYLAPSIEMLLQMRRYTESELVAALVQSYLTAWITQEAEASDNPFNEIGSEGDISDSGISSYDTDYEMGPGTINFLNPGESVTFGNPNIPSSGFESFVKTISRIIGAGLELPYDVLIKEFNSSYSAAKGALEEAWESIKVRRSCFINDFCQPIYEVWLAEAVALGRIKAPGFFSDPRIRAAWCGARWDGPAQTHLDPVKEANANLIAVANGWKTNTQVTREAYGGDWAENIEALNAEKSKFTATTIEVKTEEEEQNA